MGKYLINEYYEVAEADKTRSFGKGEHRQDYADSWKDTGNVILIGLDGSGKGDLARLLAERTGMEVLTPSESSEALEGMSGAGRIVVLGDALVEDPVVQPMIHSSGKVFYLMADTNLLSTRVAERNGVEDREQLWRDMSARLAVMEPIFYSVLHFIMQGSQTSEELVNDALEKIAF